MSGGPKFEYRWADKHKYKKPTRLPAPQYISLLMEWVEAQINDESLFPISCGIFIHLISLSISNLSVCFVTFQMCHFQKHFTVNARKFLQGCSECLSMFIFTILIV